MKYNKLENRLKKERLRFLNSLSAEGTEKLKELAKLISKSNDPEVVNDMMMKIVRKLIINY